MGILLDLLTTTFRCMLHDMHILIVDDSSPDGTADIVREKQRAHPNIHLLSGEKAGLGAAYIRGIRYAMKQLTADVVFEMDADLSHKPEDVPRLLAALEDGNDFVIGSRYVSGGTIPREWGGFRHMNSLFGNVVARYIAGLYRIQDCTAGFRAIRSSLLRKIKLDDLRVQGYAFQIALLHQALTLDAAIK